MAKIVGEMRQVKMILSRHAGALERASKDLAMVEKITASFLASVTRGLRAIETPSRVMMAIGV